MLQMIKSIDQPSIVQSHAYDLDLYLPIPQAQVPKKKNSTIFKLIMTLEHKP